MDSCVLVVLGKNWRRKPFGPSLESKMNAVAAGELYVRGAVGTIVLSGGHTAGADRPAEAEALHAVLRRVYRTEAVPDEAIVLEGRSIDTADNAAKVRELLDGRQQNRVSLLSLAAHLPAARTLFEGYGLAVERTFAAEEVLSARSPHYARLMRRYRSSPRARLDEALERGRRLLLLADRKGRVLRPLTRLLRHG